MMRIVLVGSQNPNEAAWAEAVARVLGDVPDVNIVRLDVPQLATTALDTPGAIVVASCDEGLLHRMAGMRENVVLVPPPSAVERLKEIARTGEGWLRVAALTTACHAAAQRAGLQSA